MTTAPVRGSFPRLRLLRQWMRDRREGRTKLFPTWTLLTFLFALVYFISPIDLVPELFLPVIGWIDDLGVFGLTRWSLGRDLRRYCRDVGIDPAAHGL